VSAARPCYTSPITKKDEQRQAEQDHDVFRRRFTEPSLSWPATSPEQIAWTVAAWKNSCS